MHSPCLKNSNGAMESLSNICLDSRCTRLQIEDAVEDSTTSEELIKNINHLKLFAKFSLDRETDKYVRLVMTDPWGDKKYLVAQKD